ncbi:probable inactive leucine-rich repeat receptor-like protein kinase At3g03770 isoform X2 [Physcomitrium patens]|uniref:Protein kinase domain-containing protein n=1 Tax=Physcomitrium patens TaxID=3218 RepID=A0A2K1JIV5_PHYPA|nr:probable inactive leucine-rich repeat receptor-like protein kinase At3g03770 isoform X2 [Physcomitrium patens]PNR41480.1 hypothetical protein PHYPA_018883 [Physcomitrium patens]|eukprot:XP_024394333.1 probable inactive leucine-rich repeat receptor-like protein kinase At3g03770 isoform X2 [Physcomitrella patens]
MTRKMAACSSYGLSWRLYWACSCVVLVAALTCYVNVVDALPRVQSDGLLKIQELLRTPTAKAIWNIDTDFCKLPPTSHLYINCTGDTLTYLRIVGDKNMVTEKEKRQLGSAGGSLGPKKSLPSNFSVNTLVDTLLTFPDLRGLELVSLGMWGSLPEKLSQLSSLQTLNVSSNLFTGTIPKSLHKITGLGTLALDNNALAGIFPYWLSAMSSIETLSLSDNFFTGELNDSISSFKNLSSLSVSNNLLYGNIPGSLSSLQSLQFLSLAHNRFTGNSPNLENLRSLKTLNLGGNSLGPGFPALGTHLTSVYLGQNKLSESLPDSLKDFGELHTLDISGNALADTPPAFLFNLPRISTLNLARNHFSGVLPLNLTLSKSLSVLDVSNNFLTGQLPLVFLSARNVALYYQNNCMDTLKQKQGSKEYCTITAAKLGIGSSEVHHSHLVLIIAVAAAGGLCLTVGLCGVVLLMARRCSIDKDSVAAPEDRNFGSFRGIPSELLSNARYLSQSMRLGVLPQSQNRVFALEELKVATNNFSPGALVGEGRHGKVYKGLLEDKTVVAIKWLNFKSKEDMAEYKTQLEVLNKLRHRHLVSVLGYCSEEVTSSVDDEEFKSFRLFIVSDFMGNGDLRSHLSKQMGKEPMVWSQRLAAVIAAGRGIHYLHTGVVPPIFYNNLKITSILLDSYMVAQLSDFGLPVRRVSFSMDVVAPEGKAGVPKLNHEESLRRQEHRDKQDVYDYGAILLEIVLGRPPTIRNPFPQKRSELERLTKEKGPSMELIDKDIVGTCGAESLATVLEIAGKCMVDDPTRRPSMEDVLWNLQYALQVHSSVNDVTDEHDLRREEFQKAPSFTERKRCFYDNRVSDEDWKAGPKRPGRA